MLKSLSNVYTDYDSLMYWWIYTFCLPGNNTANISWPGPVFWLLLGVSSDYAQPITGQVTEVTCPVIGRAQSELTPSKRQKTSPGVLILFAFVNMIVANVLVQAGTTPLAASILISAVTLWLCVCQKQVSSTGTSNYIPQYLWDVNYVATCLCNWCLLLAHMAVVYVYSAVSS